MSVATPSTADATPTDRSALQSPWRLSQRDWLVVLGIVILTIAAYANGLTGEFVLDDQKQIVRNDLIRTPRFWGEALTRDIWAFQGERASAWSNYWRPGHVAWLIANYQVFGARPFWWHLTNLFAHVGVIIATYALLRRIGASLAIAGAITAIFAVHPVHVESVTWIAGVHDVLATLWQLLALLCLVGLWAREQHGEPIPSSLRATRWAAAILFYVFAICTKEIAVFFPAIVALVRYTQPASSPSTRRSWLDAVRPALPFAVIALGFLAVRRLVLGATQLQFAWQPSVTTTITSIPLVLAYYLRQIVFPYWLAWSYPVRVVSGGSMNAWNFYLPLLLLVGVVAFMRTLVRGRLQIIGAAILVLTLAPALNLKAFVPEQIVKDRYLYLPLLGFLMILIPAIGAFVHRRQALRAAMPLVMTVVILLLTIQTILYNFSWRAEIPLWQRAVRSDPNSAINRAGLGVAYMIANRLPEALRSLDESIALQTTSDGLGARAEVHLRMKNYELAAQDCLRLLDAQPDNFRAFERLAIARERQGRLDDAAQVFRTARQRVPYRYAVFTDQLAVVLYKQGKKQEALDELVGAKDQAEADFSPGSRLAMFHLGMLYGELNDRERATYELRRFIDLTEGSADPNIIGARRKAAAAVNDMQSPGWRPQSIIGQ